jgi:hypothetical protein
VVHQQVLTRADRFEQVRLEGSEDEPYPRKVKEIWVHDKQYIVCKNEWQAGKDEATRNVILESLDQQLQSGA